MNRKERRAAGKTEDVNQLMADAVAKHRQGALADAVLTYRKVIRLWPALADAHVNLGVALRALGRVEEAIAAYRQAIRLQPRDPEIFFNLANALQQAGQPAEAIGAYEQAIALRPNYAEAHLNLGVVLRDQGRWAEAAAAYGQALRFAPGWPEAYRNLAEVLGHLGDFAAAITAARHAIAGQPGDATAYRHLGAMLDALGETDEAIAAFEAGLSRDPGDAAAIGRLAMLRRRVCDWRSFDTDEAALIDLVRRRREPAPPFFFLATRGSAADQLAAARLWTERAAGTTADRHARKGTVKARDRLRIGYMSSDFRAHAVAYLIAELFERHDRSRFEVYGYALNPPPAAGGDDDAMYRRLSGAFDRFTSLHDLPTAAAAERLRADDLDILIDLNGHTQHARTDVLALRPAPIQVSFLGYPGSMGADFIDYAIVDRIVVPPEQQPHFTERLVHLPDCYQPNDRKRSIAAAQPSRSDCGLPPDAMVFCCFNNAFKLTPVMFDLWMRLLAAVPGSVLWLLDGGERLAETLRTAAVTRGIAGDRLIFAPRRPLPEHLARHRLADLFLDTLPYNAHTTASDALWAGLPVLTCLGETFAGRVAASLLTAVGLPDLITRSLAEYETLALQLAHDPKRRQSLRDRLAEARDRAPLFDSVRFARHLENAFSRMAEIHRAGHPPQGFAV